MDADYDGEGDIERGWREGLIPDPLLSVSEWSDRHRMLSSKASSEPGRWRTTRTPYLKAIMDCLSPTSPVERVVFMKAAQLGATEMGNNWIGYVIHHAPGPMMAVWPTVDMAKNNSKQRIDPLIEESPVLAERIMPPRSRDSGNTILAKEFRGGVLRMVGANSAVGLRSMPVRYLFLDEVDGYPVDVDGEGSAVALAEARTRTFARRKIFIVSTPTVAGVSTIEREYEASDQRRYFVPCPHCGHRQWLRFEQLRWARDETEAHPETVAYVCEACEVPIPEHHKTWMLEHGEWRAMAEGARRTVGFHLSSLYSPIGWRSWREIAAAWERAIHKVSGSAAAIKTFKNTELGETWVEEGEAPDWQRLLERREDYRLGSIPPGGLLLTGGADIQKDRIEVSIWAFGRGKASWLVEHRVLMGDTARAEVWHALARLIDETWCHASGAAVPLVRFAIDTGFATQEAYAFVRAVRDARVMAVKGVARGAALVGSPTAVDVTAGGKKLRRGIKVFSVAGGIAKLEFYNNLRKAADVAEDGVTPVYPVGFVHLPKVDAEFLQQLCAEQLVTRRDRNGFALREWQKMRERNEGLDCFDAETDVLTYAGWKRFGEVGYGDLLATVDLDSDLIEYQTPQVLIDRSYEGDLMVVDGKCLNFAVTPAHRMVTFRKVYDRKIGKWNFDVPPKITLAQDLTIHHTIKINASWRGNGLVDVKIPASLKSRGKVIIEPERIVPAAVMASLLGWYIAEGWTQASACGKTIMRTVGISQTKPEGRQGIEGVLDALPWNWRWDASGAVISSKQLYDYIAQMCPGLQDTRRVPQWIKDAGEDVINAFVEAAIAGDGWTQNGSRSYATVSKGLADDMAELFIKMGGSPSVTSVQRDGWCIRGQGGDQVLPQFWVRENNRRRSASLDGADRTCMVRAVPYSGRVYCATVPNGTLIVRRHGKMLVAGNCYVYARAAAAASGLDRFEERHWRELEKQLGIATADPPDVSEEPHAEATPPGGLSVSGVAPARRRLIRSRWLT